MALSEERGGGADMLTLSIVGEDIGAGNNRIYRIKMSSSITCLPAEQGLLPGEAVLR